MTRYYLAVLILSMSGNAVIAPLTADCSRTSGIQPSEATPRLQVRLATTTGEQAQPVMLVGHSYVPVPGLLTVHEFRRGLSIIQFRRPGVIEDDRFDPRGLQTERRENQTGPSEPNRATRAVRSLINQIIQVIEESSLKYPCQLAKVRRTNSHEIVIELYDSNSEKYMCEIRFSMLLDRSDSEPNSAIAAEFDRISQLADLFKESDDSPLNPASLESAGTELQDIVANWFVCESARPFKVFDRPGKVDRLFKSILFWFVDQYFPNLRYKPQQI